MFFDSLGIDFGTGVYIFPDFPFAARPLPNSDIMDTVILTGSSSSDISLTGNADPGNSTDCSCT